jgi:hypothetical protein
MDSNSDGREHLRSNRLYLRIKTEIPCEVGLKGGGFASVQIIDLSEGGLKFGCGHQTIQQIMPEEGGVGLIVDTTIEVKFTLPSPNKRATAIKTNARLIHSERLAQDLFHVGVQFVALNRTAISKLEAFVEESKG